jgi:hypothetical protein
MKEQADEPEIILNPIDEKKVAENPNLMEYAHTVGGFVIKPTEKGQIRGKAMAAMEQQTTKQLKQLYEQMQTLAKQAEKLQERAEVSRQIYEAEMSFEPIMGHIYYLYRRKNGIYILSMVSPEEWGKKIPYTYLSKVQLLADHTWEVMDEFMQEF